MEYYKLLQLKREPFSNSPDPEYFFHSHQHHACLQKLELAIRLKRGLNVVMGDIGTGKTTLCREIIRKFNQESSFETHLILDPAFQTTEQFLTTLSAMLCSEKLAKDLPEMALKEKIKQTLFKKGIELDQTIVLIIDEGQKISPACIEILRELLNYETNNYKLLQIVIFAQEEFNEILLQHANFTDRINLLHRLKPMSFSDTRNMIYHRLKLSSSTPKPAALFTLPALWAIYRATKGYPRKIVHLCHQSVLTMIIQNRTNAGWKLVRSCHNRITESKKFQWRTITAAAMFFILMAAVGVLLLNNNLQYLVFKSGQAGVVTAVPSPERPLNPVNATKPAPEIKVAQLTQQQPQQLSSNQSDSADQHFDAPGADAQPAPERQIANPLVIPDTPTALQSDKPVEPASPVEHDPAPIPPVTLGQLDVMPGDTLTDLIQMVYASTSNRLVRSVIDANPQIDNPNDIDLDDTITFPAISFSVDEVTIESNYIVISQFSNLTEARNHMEQIKDTHNIEAHIIPHWLPDKGLAFSLIAPSSFDDKRSAEQWIASLPEELAMTAKIQWGWPDDQLTYSNYFRSKHRQPTTMTRR